MSQHRAPELNQAPNVYLSGSQGWQQNRQTRPGREWVAPDLEPCATAHLSAQPNLLVMVVRSDRLVTHEAPALTHQYARILPESPKKETLVLVEDRNVVPAAPINELTPTCNHVAATTRWFTGALRNRELNCPLIRVLVS